jgi:hypothetical protein
MESRSNRLRRFLDGDPHEVFGTLLDSLNNYVLPEIEKARDERLENLGFLGTHAVVQIVTEKILGFRRRQSMAGTRHYLQHFVDRPTPDRTYSTISDDLHLLRNNIAHLWFSSRSHSIAIDYQIDGGWKRVAETLHVNPRIYFDDFLSGYRERIWALDETFMATERARLQKYRYIADWLEVADGDPIRVALKLLAEANDEATRQQAEGTISGEIQSRFLTPSGA